jgi:hypothetical protein
VIDGSYNNAKLAMKRKASILRGWKERVNEEEKEWPGVCGGKCY